VSGARRRVLGTTLALAAVLLVHGSASAADDHTGAGQIGSGQTNAGKSCAVPSAVAALGAALSRSAGLVDQGRGVTIVALGSSSTAGTGASSPAMSYPSRLERDLHELFPALPVKVVNRGQGGQDVGEELARLDPEMVAERPDLVIWQVGTNALLRQADPAREEQLIGRGVELIKQHGVDVVLMDLQYAPRVLARPAWRDMEELIARTARRERVGLFQRFELMREWARTGQLGTPALIGRDGLHMTDVSYGCLADRLAQALAGQWQSQNKVVQAPHRSPAVLARAPPAVAASPR
jgi:lysophospholipase L1-like esterase